jgi:diguanylate cyclase (GGDEF)-like protein
MRNVDRMTMRPLSARDGDAVVSPNAVHRLLRVDRSFGVIDACLVAVAVAMVFSAEMILLLQMTILLLMLGGYYWRFPGFIARSVLWVGVATAEMVLAVSLGDTPASDLLALPLLVVMLAIFYALSSRRYRAERTLSQAELHDHLTRLPNRRNFLRRLDEALIAAAAERRAIAVVSLDIDGFKAVNDDYGHDLADRILVVLADRLRGCVRGDDTVARVGGDEFMIVVGAEAGAVPRIAERIAAAVETPFAVDGVEVRVTASVGVALSEEPERRERDDLVRHAEAAMRRVKAEGKAGYEVFSPLSAVA